MSKKLAESVFWEFKILDEIYKTTAFSKLPLNLNDKDFNYSKLLTEFSNTYSNPNLQSPKQSSAIVEPLDRDSNGSMRDPYKNIVTTCNNLKLPEYHKTSYDLLKSLNDCLPPTAESFKSFAHTEDPTVFDVIVLSSLSRCKIWSKVLKVNKTDGHLFQLFSWYNHMNGLYKSFIEHEIDPTIQTRKLQRRTFLKQLEKISNPPFIEAVKRERLEEIEGFLKSGVSPDIIDPTDNQKTALCIACDNESLTLAKMLLAYGADLEAEDAEQMTPAFYAIKSENVELIDYLFDIGADFEHLDCQNRTPFYWACCQCNITLIDHLYKKGCKHNVYSKLDRSPLSKTAYIGRADAVCYLLALPDIDIDHKDNRGRTALHNAVWGPTGGREGKRIGSTNPEDCPEAAQLLIEAGANVDTQDFDGNSVIAVATSSFALRSIDLLMAYGADINAPNILNETPLSQACRYGHFKVVKKLVEEYNPDRWVKNAKGFDCVQTTVACGHLDLLDYFLSQDKQILHAFTQEGYYKDLLRCLSAVVDDETRGKVLELIFKYIKQYNLHIAYDEPVAEVVIKARNKTLLTQLLDVVNQEDLNETVLVSLISMLMKNNWFEGIEFIMKEYESQLGKLQMKWYELGDEGFIRGGSELVDSVLKNLQIDFTCQKPNGDALLHVLVRKRRLPVLIAFFNMTKDVLIHGKEYKNKYLVSLTQAQWKQMLSYKDSEELTFLDIALVRRYMDVYSILKGYVGQEYKVEIKVPKYNLQVVEEVASYHHSQKDRLESIAALYKDKDEADKKEDEKELAEEVKEEVKTTDKEVLNVPIFQLTPAEVSQMYKLSKDSADLRALKTLWATQIGKSKKIDAKPLMEGRKVIFVDKLDDLREVAEKLGKAGILGVDLEYYSEERDNSIGMVCTMQVSTVDVDFVIDTIFLREHIGKELGSVFNSWDTIKLFHGCDSDLRWLKNDFNIDCVRVFDTARAEMLLDQSTNVASLGMLCQKYLGLDLDKSYQTSDWRVRPLPLGMLDYARKDSSVLIYLWWVMMPVLDKRAAKEPLWVRLTASLAKLCYKKLEKVNMKRALLVLES